MAPRGTHCAPAQPYPAAQSVSFWQVALQCAPASSHARLPAQDCGVPATQRPRPSHVLRVCRLLVQDVPHTVVAGGYWHSVVLRAPLQLPVQAAVVPVQAARRPWGGPTTGEQTPGDPATSHASHCPPQAVSQHTPSTQWVLAQSPSALHAAPLGVEPWQAIARQRPLRH
jgi:hypothetical protein